MLNKSRADFSERATAAEVVALAAMAQVSTQEGLASGRRSQPFSVMVCEIRYTRSLGDHLLRQGLAGLRAAGAGSGAQYCVPSARVAMK